MDFGYAASDHDPATGLICPYDEPKEISIEVGRRPLDLYDAVSKRWVKKGVEGQTAVRLAKDSAALFVHVPAGAETVSAGSKLLANGVVVDSFAGGGD